MSDILVLAEYANGVSKRIKKTSWELLSKAGELASQTGGKVAALVIGSNVEDLVPELASYGAQKVVVVSHPSFEKYNTLGFSKAFIEAINQLKPTIILGTASPLGKDLFPRVAARLQAGLASEATDVRLEGGKLKACHPVYSGKAIVDVEFNTPIQMATTRPNSFPVKPVNVGAQVEVIKLSVNPETLRAPMKEISQGEVGKVDLTEAEIIVSGGRAMANSENFKVLREMAEVIHASVGASRAAVDSGYAPHDMQVGQTGKVVNPKLYIACGISGAIQHLAGMRTSKIIVAINKDPEAPIFSKADYGIVGDLFTIVPLLTQEFKKLMAE